MPSSDVSRRMAETAGGFVRLLARKRVPLGFVAAISALVLATPTWVTWSVGLLVAIAGEGIRIWAAGHLEKNREVTRSGPYRFTAHPLYVGSTVMAAGIALAARSLAVAVVAALYMGLTIPAAMRAEELDLRQAFGSAYDDYRTSPGSPTTRRFSLARAIRNREHRAITGLLVGFALLALKAMLLGGL